jgi:broad specificity phosphatase PhoE
MNASDFLPYRDLLVHIIKQAVLDLSYRAHSWEFPPKRRGQLDAESLKEYTDRVRAEAADWLRGDVCQDWCEFLEVDHGAVVKRVTGAKA